MQHKHELVAGQHNVASSQNVTKLACFLCGPYLRQRDPRRNVVALLVLGGAVSVEDCIVCRPNERLPAVLVLARARMIGNQSAQDAQ